MLEIKNLNIKIGLKTIINYLSFNIGKNEKLAIIGEEGNGKSTLLKAIVGRCDYADVTGDILTKGSIGYLEQYINSVDLNKSVYDYLFNSKEDYYNKINDLYKYLNSLSINAELIDRDCLGKLSGGEKVKIQLLKLLLDNVDILLLDELTNDLDIETLEWLENFIINCNKPIIYVSHDEILLEKTANMILHLELIKRKTECKWQVMRTLYKDYVEERLHLINRTTQIARKEKENFDKQQEKLQQVMNKVHHQQDTITRQNPHGGKMLKRKMKSLKSQEKRLENVELTESPDYEKEINLFFKDVFIPNGKRILDIKNQNIQLENKVLISNLSLEIYGPQKIVIIGRNGVGKTTLLKSIYNELSKRSDIKVGYMPQDYDNILEKFSNPIDFLINNNSNEEITKVRTFMGNMHFTHEEMTDSIDNLSGGSKAKLILLKLVINEYNVLILDEPTRNVSPLSNPVIREALKNFKGCIISVSHDRKYISEVCDTVYVLTKEGLLRKE